MPPRFNLLPAGGTSKPKRPGIASCASRQPSPVNNLPAMTAGQNTVARSRSRTDDQLYSVSASSVPSVATLRADGEVRCSHLQNCSRLRDRMQSRSDRDNISMASTSGKFSNSHHRNEFGVYGMDNRSRLRAVLFECQVCPAGTDIISWTRSCDRGTRGG